MDIVVECECIDSESDSSDSPPAKRRCCLKQRVFSLLTSGRASDITFNVGQGDQKQSIPAHKNLLLVASDVLSAMFSDNWSAESNTIDVPDINPPAFRALLSFLYTNEVLLTFETAPDVLYVARKYEVRPLEKLCVNFMIENLRPTNAFAALNHGRLLDIQRLINASLETIYGDTTLAVKADAFCEVTKETLCLILGSDSLTISELALFEAVLRWSEAECWRKNLQINTKNQRSVLDEVIQLIRFPIMTANEFSSKVTTTDILTNSEIMSLYRYFSEKSKPPTQFSDAFRCWKGVIVNRFTSSEVGCVCDGHGDFIHFTPDRDVYLKGYGLYCSLDSSAKYEIVIKLHDALTNDKLNETLAVYHSTGDSTTYKILLKNPVKLAASKKYTVRVYVTGPDCLRGTGGFPSITVDLPHGRKLTVTFESVDTGVKDLQTTISEGQIPQLIFIA